MFSCRKECLLRRDHTRLVSFGGAKLYLRTLQKREIISKHDCCIDPDTGTYANIEQWKHTQ